MERIKQSLSDVVHNWTAIGMITLFLFSVQPGPTITQALEVKPQKTEKQLKRENLIKKCFGYILGHVYRFSSSL